MSARDYVDGPAYLAGAYAPVAHEHDHARLELLEGEVPSGLRGCFARNSSNPRFAPPEPYHWFDGDGMIHAATFADGSVSYANRWVRTAGLDEDEQAGRATWTGMLARPDLQRPGGPYKNTANTDLIGWNGKLLALWWQGGGLPYALDDRLHTLGPFADAGTMTAHAKVDPRSGDLVFLDYGTSASVTHGVLTRDGVLTRTTVPLPGPRPQHDLALTERYTILIDVSMFPDPELLARGKLQMRMFADVPTRLGLFDRRTHQLLRWFEVPACYVYHFANAWEQDNEVVVYACRVRDPLAYDPQPGRSDRVVPHIAHLRLEPQLVRWTLNLASGEAREDVVDPALAEFPRVDDRRIGAPTKAAYLSSFAERPQLEFAGVRRVSLASGQTIERRWPDGWVGGELSLAPLADDEDDAVLLSFVSTRAGDRAELWLLDASTLATVARLAIPSHVPVGFHSRWLPG
jgi:carotenoid cleavage dioxygenase